MKKLLLSMTFVVAATVSGFAQNNLSANVFTGLFFPFNDFTSTDYEGYKPNLGVGAGIGYNFGDAFRLRGDLLYGTMNGNNEAWYYQTTIFEPHLSGELDFLGLFSDEGGLKLNLRLGTGFSIYQANLYDRGTGARLTESPPRNRKALSPNAFVSYGANFGIPLSHKLDLTIGYQNRYVFDNDWMDGFASGEATDQYGFASIGFVYYLKSDRAPGTVEVEEEKYQKLTAESDSAMALREKLLDEKERVDQLEMEQQEQNMVINNLKAELDSAKAMAATNYDTITRRSYAPSATPPTEAVAAEILSEPAYRIIVASLPTREMAQRWIDKSTLDKSEMVIAYIADLNTHRVIYKSYDTFPAARKEQQRIKRSIADAWIIKF
jgi:hypothetical protein